MRNSAFQALLVCACVSSFLVVAATARSFGAAADSLDVKDDNRAVQAIWLVQSIPFEFRSETIGYTCDSFERKLRAVLIAVGVHPSLIIEARCQPSRIEPTLPTRRRPRFPGEVESVTASPSMSSKTSSRISAVIAFASPAVASEENVRRATTFDTQAQLVAQMKGEELPTASSIPVFPAIWAPIELSSKSDPWLQAGDCELLRQLSTQVFPKIGVEVSRKLLCPASMPSKVSLDVEALLPIR